MSVVAAPCSAVKRGDEQPNFVPLGRLDCQSATPSRCRRPERVVLRIANVASAIPTATPDPITGHSHDGGPLAVNRYAASAQTATQLTFSQ